MFHPPFRLAACAPAAAMAVFPFFALLSLTALSAAEQLSGVSPAAAAAVFPESGLASITSLDVYAESQVLHVLVSGTSGGKGPEELRYFRSGDGGATWSAPHPIETGDARPYRPSAANSVQIAAAGATLLAAWGGKGTGANPWGQYGPIVTARSQDGGRTWRLGGHPDDSVQPSSEQDFIDLAADASGVFHIVWLDGRPAVEGPHSAVATAASADGGATWGKAITVDGATCTCCANRIATGQGGRVAILYRDAVPRDMGLALSVNRGADWELKGPAGAFSWNFQGCPHVGGGLAFADGAEGTLHATVWTGREDRAGVYALALRSGTVWSSPIRLGSANARHSDIAVTGRGRLLAAWEDTQDGSFAILAAYSDDGGATWSAPSTVRVSREMVSHPKIAAVGEGFRVFWTEHSGKRVVWGTSVPMPPPPRVEKDPPPERKD